MRGEQSCAISAGGVPAMLLLPVLLLALLLLALLLLALLLPAVLLPAELPDGFSCRRARSPTRPHGVRSEATGVGLRARPDHQARDSAALVLETRLSAALEARTESGSLGRAACHTNLPTWASCSAHALVP